MREFATFRLDSVNQCLWRQCECAEDRRVQLTPKAYAVLAYLVEHAGRLVTQEELLQAVWPYSFVQPEVLKYQIADIRGVLGDSAKQPSFIETLPRRGYRFIAGVREAASEPTAHVGLAATRFVGRQRELASLREAFRLTQKGERQLIFITGEAGIGKTALVEEFVRVASTEPSLRIARGHTVTGASGSEPFYPVLNTVGQLCRGPDGSELIELLAQHAPTWLVQFPGLMKSEHRERLQAEIRGATRDRMLREIREALDAFASEKPVLYVYDDVHWLDPSSLDLLSAYAHDRVRAKAMVIIAMRPAEEPGTFGPIKRIKQDLLVHNLGFEIPLGPLSEAEVESYFESDSSGSSLPEGFSALVHRRSEGNPLFMVAILERMLQKNQVSHEEGKWKLGVPLEEIDLDVPESLRQSIEGQIDQLAIVEQRALEAASVAGASFSALGLAGVTGIGRAELLELFESLSRRSRFIRPGPCQQLEDGTIVQVFEFVHALYREVFFWRQTPARRASLQRAMSAQ